MTYPSWEARREKRLRNRLKHAGIDMPLDTSDETIAFIKRNIDRLEQLAEAADDDHAKAKYLATMQNAAEYLVTVQTKREATKGNTEAAVSVVPKIIAALEEYPEAKAAVLRALG